MTLLPWKDFELRDNRVSDACRLITDHVADHDWHSWAAIVTSVSEATGLQFKTISNLLRGMLKAGQLERRGSYGQPDRREVKLL